PPPSVVRSISKSPILVSATNAAPILFPLVSAAPRDLVWNFLKKSSPPTVAWGPAPESHHVWPHSVPNFFSLRSTLIFTSSPPSLICALRCIFKTNVIFALPLRIRTTLPAQLISTHILPPQMPLIFSSYHVLPDNIHR